MSPACFGCPEVLVHPGNISYYRIRTWGKPWRARDDAPTWWAVSTKWRDTSATSFKRPRGASL